MREIKLRCQTSGFYSHWRLTEAQGQTFTEVEMGVEPLGLLGRLTPRPYRRVTSAAPLRRRSTASRRPGADHGTSPPIRAPIESRRGG